MTTRTADLTPDDFNEIVRRYKAKESPDVIGNDYGIHRGRILLIVKMNGGTVLKWNRRTLSAEEEQIIIKKYRDDFIGATTLAADYGIDKGTVYNIMKRAGVGVRSVGNRKPPTLVQRKSRVSDKDKEMAALFVSAIEKGGLPKDILDQLGGQFGMHPTSIVYALKKQGVDTRSKADQEFGLNCRIVKPVKTLPEIDPRKGQTRAPINDNAFDVITDDAAYWIGMMMADGCVHWTSPLKTAKKFSLGLSGKDVEHVQRFRDFLGLDKAVALSVRSTFGDTRNHATISATSDRIIERLEHYGVIPNKTGHESAHPELAFNPHFWRGMVDGDGSIYPNGFYLSGPTGLLESLERFCQFYYPDFKIRIYEQPGVFVGHVRGELVGKGMLRILYDGAKLALPRKQQQALEALGQ
jgi:hypothetical protein